MLLSVRHEPLATLRCLRGQAWTVDYSRDDSCENTLLLPYRNHAKHSNSNSQHRGFAAVDSGRGRPGEFRILPATILRAGRLDAAFWPLARRCKPSEHAESSGGYR